MALAEERRSGCDRKGVDSAKRRRLCWPDIVRLVAHLGCARRGKWDVVGGRGWREKGNEGIDRTGLDADLCHSTPGKGASQAGLFRCRALQQHQAERNLHPAHAPSHCDRQRRQPRAQTHPHSTKEAHAVAMSSRTTVLCVPARCPPNATQDSPRPQHR